MDHSNDDCINTSADATASPPASIQPPLIDDGPAPMRRPDPQLPVAILEWRPYRSGNLRGFCKILIGRTLIVNDVKIGTANGRARAGLPSKPFVIDGKQLVDD